GIALVGAIQAAERHGFTIQRAAGTSSGAIAASLLMAGYTAEQMKRLIIDTPLMSFIKPKDWMKVKWIGPPIRLFLKRGLYSGDPLEQWISETLAHKNVHTFGDIPKNKLRIIASDITSGRLMVLPDDLPKYDLDPDTFPIARAVRMSTSIPYFF